METSNTFLCLLLKASSNKTRSLSVGCDLNLILFSFGQIGTVRSAAD